jgi:hypothetical protein
MNNFVYNLSEYSLVSFPKLFIGIAGVYLWTNNVNGKRYVGSSNNIGRRIGEYLNKNRLVAELVRGESLIYKAILKYGRKSFSLTILESIKFDDNISPEDKSNILELREQKYLDSLKPQYNLLKTAGSNQGFKMSREARAKISRSKIGKLSHRKGTTISDETRELIRQMSAKSKRVYMYSLNNTTFELINTFDSISSCAIQIKLSRFQVGRKLDTIKLVKQKYYFTSKPFQSPSTLIMQRDHYAPIPTKLGIGAWMHSSNFEKVLIIRY